jgi:hypothetical protein
MDAISVSGPIFCYTTVCRDKNFKNCNYFACAFPKNDWRSLFLES